MKDTYFNAYYNNSIMGISINTGKFLEKPTQRTIQKHLYRRHHSNFWYEIFGINPIYDLKSSEPIYSEYTGVKI